MRSALLTTLVVALLATSPAAHAGPGPTSPPPPAVSVASDGTVGYAYPGDGLLVAAGSLERGLGEPVVAAPLEEIASSPFALGTFGPWSTPFWVVAEPGGGVRVLWVARLADYSRPDFGIEYQLRSRRLGGPVETVSPALTAPPDVDVAANPRGGVLAVWSGGGAFAAAGSSFAAVRGAVPADPQAALAASGAALVAGRECDSGACAITVREAPDGTAFGAATALADSSDVGGLDAALASDGSALIAGARNGASDGPLTQGSALAYVRRGREGFAGPVSLDRAIVGAARAGVGNGGRGVVTAVNTTGSSSVVELEGGSAGPPMDVMDVHAAAPALAVRDDGAALVGLQFEGVLERSASGRFERRPPVIGDVLTAVALGERGSAIGWPEKDPADFSAPPRYRAHIAERPQELPFSAPRARASEYPEAGRSTGPGGLAVVRGPVRARGGRALVPVVCPDYDPSVTGRDWCRGILRATGRRVRFGVPSGAGRYVRVPVGRRTRRLRLVLSRPGTERPDTRRSLRVVRRPDGRGCRAPAWAATLVRDGDRRLLAVTRRRSPDAVTDIVACDGASRGRRLLTLAPNASTAGYPPVLAGRWAAFAERHIVAGRSEVVLHTLDLRSGKHRARTLYSNAGSPFFGHDFPRPIALRVSRTGAVAMTEGTDGRVRVRALDAGGDRVLDAGPGVDEGSLAVRGDRATWTRAGAPQEARLR